MLRRAPSVGAGCRWWAGGEAGSCTESLGSESGDVGCDAAEIDQLFFPPPAPATAGSVVPDAAGADADVAALCGVEEDVTVEPENKGRRGGSGFGFPPAMARASGALVLRAERRGGRLILTEVRADEHERRVVFQARRDGGRLRLRFANDDDAPERGGESPEASVADDAGGVVVPVAAVQHTGGGGGGGKLCQVAAGAAAAGRRGGVEVGAVMMGTI